MFFLCGLCGYFFGFLLVFIRVLRALRGKAFLKWKNLQSTIYNLQSTIPNRCDNCFFSIWTISPNRPALICMQKASRVGKWHVVLLEQSCPNFYPSSTYRSSCRSSSEDGKQGSKTARRIPLTKGKFAIVDAEDYYQLAQFQWFISPGTNTLYAAGKRGEKRAIMMHRVIMDAPDHLVVDHIDHNGLNNTKANLRLCTRAQNNCNCTPNKGTTSRHKGVSWNKKMKKWRVAIKLNEKTRHIGYFENEIDAAKAYDKKAAKLFGEFACLNFPPPAE
jgi:hypothetical protein